MTAKKRSDDPAGPAVSEPPANARGSRWMLVCAVMVLAVCGLSFVLWQQVREHVTASNDYVVDPQKFNITPPPPWIHTDIRADVFREASFAGPLSLLDDELTPRVASAFATHPWVQEVTRVSKHYPGTVDVDLIYRQPVAMVEVEPMKGVLPADIFGVVLPDRDFTALDVRQYARIGAIRSSAPDVVGAKWNDPDVIGGAQIAAAIGTEWLPLKLARIEPAGRKPGRTGMVESYFVIVTSGGTRVHWGMAPGANVLGEPSVADKVAGLRAYYTEHGSLESPEGQLVFSEGGKLIEKIKPPVKAIFKND